jgi:hypothetical protein
MQGGKKRTVHYGYVYLIVTRLPMTEVRDLGLLAWKARRRTLQEMHRRTYVLRTWEFSMFASDGKM